MSFIWLTVLIFCIRNILSDCPLSNYPRQVILAFINAELSHQLNEDDNIFIYPLQQPFSRRKIQVAIGVVSLSKSPNNTMEFSIKYLISSSVDQLKFRVMYDLTWNLIRFSFMASQSHLLQLDSLQVEQFSKGIKEGQFAAYQKIPNNQFFSEQTVLKIFIQGISLQSLETDEEFQNLQRQYQNFKLFSINKQLIQYFSQIIEENKSLKLAIKDPQLINRFISFTIVTNCYVSSLTFSYIIFSDRAFSEMHNQINGQFNLVYDSQYEFKGIRNMDMLLAGIISISFPQDSLFSFELAFNNFLDRSVFSVISTHSYLHYGFAYIAMEIKHRFVCSDCQNSPLIFDNVCVEKCPKSYSQVKTQINTYCQRCSINQFKVIDPNTFQCVCASRFFKHSDNKCQPCKYYCLTCQNANQCLTCDNALENTKRTFNDGKCSCPQVGYYDNDKRQDIVCQKCHHNCLTCQGPYPHDCLTCDEDKKLDSYGHCVCRFGFTLTDQGFCTCIPPLFIRGQCITLNPSCNQNQTIERIGFNNRCKCKEGFIQVLDRCIKCEENQQFDEDKLECTCINKTIRFEGKCLACGQNQIYDESTGRCVCEGNTFQTENPRKCISCPPKMTYQNQQCECIFNYYEIEEGLCRKCERETDGPRCRRIVI